MSPTASAHSTSYAVPALEKGLRVLEDLASVDEPLGVEELANRQGRGRNQIYRMVHCLEQMGYLTRDPLTRRYALSLKLHGLANQHPPMARLRRAARPVIRRFAESIGESCHVCLLDGDALTVADQVSGGERIRIAFSLGAWFDPLETCSGKLLLSQLAAEPRERVLEASALWASMGERGRDTLRRDMEARRATRLWEEDSRLRPGVRDIAVAVGGPETVLAAFAVAHLPDRRGAASVRRIRRGLKDAAAAVESRLGLRETTTD